nr:Vitamin B12-binding protein precursor [Candidatus Pantoea persica]
MAKPRWLLGLLLFCGSLFAAGITPVAVSAWQGVNIERILALKPDVVLAWRGGNPQRQFLQFAQ